MGTEGERTSESLGTRVTGLIEALGGETGQEPGISTGDPILDEATQGLRPGDLWTVSGEAGTGKTALVTSMAASAAMGGVDVTILSLEQTPRELSLGLLGMARAHQAEAREVLQDHVRIVSYPRATVSGLVSVMGATGEEPRALFVDGFNLMAADSTSSQRYEQVAQAARALKAAALESGMSVVVTVPAQAVRTQRGKPVRRAPTLADIKGTGELVGASDVVVLMDAQALGGDDAEDRPAEDWAEISVAKNRRGGAATSWVALPPKPKCEADDVLA